MLKVISFLLSILTPVALMNTIELNSSQTSFLFIFSLVIWGWLFTKTPLFITGILGVCASVFLSITTTKEALASFAHPIIFIFLGGYLFAEALQVRKIDRRIALNILTRPSIKKTPHKVFFALFALTAFFSMWISNTATTAMMVPIVLGVLHNFESLQNKKMQSLVLLGVAYSANIGGIATPIGSTPNILTIGLLKETAQIELSFLSWLLIALPIAVIFLGVLYLYINRSIPKDCSDIDFGKLEEEKASLKDFSKEDNIILRLFILMVLCWFIPSFIPSLKKFLHPGIVAIFFSSLLFVFPLREKTILENQSLKNIDWSSLLLFGAGLTLGKMFFTTGLASMTGDYLVENITGQGIFLAIALLVFVSIFATELTSNTATANILLPIVISMALSTNNSVLAITMPVAIACSLAFMLPVATPPNVIVYGTDKVELKDMMRFGFFLNIVFGVLLSFIFFLLAELGVI